MEMKSMLPLLICFYYAMLLRWVEGNSGVQALKLGDTVTLSCEIKVEFEVMWFILRPNNSLSLAMLTNVRADKVSLTPTPQFGPRLVPAYRSSEKRMELRIENVTAEDVGLYYCAMRVGNMVEIGNSSEVTLSTAAEPDEQDCWTVIGVELPGFIALMAAPPLSVLLSAAVILLSPCHLKEPKRRN